MENPKIIFVHGRAFTGTSFLIDDILEFIYRDDPRYFFNICAFPPLYSVNKSKYSNYETVVMDQQPYMHNTKYDYFNRFLTLGKRSLIVLTAFGSMRDDLLPHLTDAEYQDFVDNHDILDIETFRDVRIDGSSVYLRSFSHNGAPRQYFDGTYDARFLSEEEEEDTYRYRVEIQDKLNELMDLERYKK